MLPSLLHVEPGHPAKGLEVLIYVRPVNNIAKREQESTG